MDHPEGADLQQADRVAFDRRVRLEFNGTQLSSDGGLLVMRELDDALGLSDLASAALRDTRTGKNSDTCVYHYQAAARIKSPIDSMLSCRLLGHAQSHPVHHGFGIGP
jgi:hypothetical protein